MKFFSKNDEGGMLLKDWAHDKVQSITIRCNVLLVLCIVSLSALSFGMVAVMEVTKAKTIEPFVIEIAKRSGIVTLVDPVTVKQYSANRSVNEYFLIKYMKARETFNPNTFKYYYYTEVRLLSSPDVYNSFKYHIRLSNQDSPLNLYANVLDSDLKIRSIQYISDNAVQVRFSVNYKEKSRVTRRDKIAMISYSYMSLEMNEDERFINPLGFVITSYKVDDEFL